MIGGGSMLLTRAPGLSVAMANRRKQVSQPSRQPSSSLPTPGHRAISLGRVMTCSEKLLGFAFPVLFIRALTHTVLPAVERKELDPAFPANHPCFSNRVAGLSIIFPFAAVKRLGHFGNRSGFGVHQNSFLSGQYRAMYLSRFGPNFSKAASLAGTTTSNVSASIKPNSQSATHSDFGRGIKIHAKSAM